MAKYAHDQIVPFEHGKGSKKEQVAEMFNKIAFRYDFINRFLSVGIDVAWRKKAIQQLKVLQPQEVLDIATGTGDVAMMTYKMLRPKKIIGIDISTGMLEMGRKKVAVPPYYSHIELLEGDSEAIPFEDNRFDAITVAFGVRNFENLELGLKEMLRVLRPGGKAVILEFSKPRFWLAEKFYQLYMKLVAPNIAKAFNSNKEAYQYLNESVQAFPEGNRFIQIMHETGFTQTYLRTLSFGICTIYCGSK